MSNEPENTDYSEEYYEWIEQWANSGYPDDAESLAHEAMEGFDDWGNYDDDIEDYDSDYPDCEIDIDIVDVIDLGIEVTTEGFLLQRDKLILSDGSEDVREYFLTIGCDDGEIPF